MGWRERYDTDEEEQEVHVLAVDDNFVDRTVIERLLRSSACKVTVVESGRRALQLLGLDEEKKGQGQGDFHGLNPKVDMVITDYCMPGMTGYELLKRIKESSVLREIPVVVMSSERIVARIDRCMEEGAEEFLLKPVKLSDVKRLKDNMRRKGGNPGRRAAPVNGRTKTSILPPNKTRHLHRHPRPRLRLLHPCLRRYQRMFRDRFRLRPWSRAPHARRIKTGC